MMIIVLTPQFALREPPSPALYENPPQEPVNAELTHSRLMWWQRGHEWPHAPGSFLVSTGSILLEMFAAPEQWEGGRNAKDNSVNREGMEGSETRRRINMLSYPRGWMNPNRGTDIIKTNFLSLRQTTDDFLACMRQKSRFLGKSGNNNNNNNNSNIINRSATITTSNNYYNSNINPDIFIQKRGVDVSSDACCLCSWNAVCFWVLAHLGCPLQPVRGLHRNKCWLSAVPKQAS